MQAKPMKLVSLFALLAVLGSCGLNQTSQAPQAPSESELNDQSPPVPAPATASAPAPTPAKAAQSKTAAGASSSPRILAAEAKKEAYPAKKPAARAKAKPKMREQAPAQIMERTRQILPAIRYAEETLDRENYQPYEDNGTKLARNEPVSTFSIDVDTGSYSNARRMLKLGRLPVKSAVRAEEFINYFNYDYPAPKDDTPFSFLTEVGPNPWNKDSYLLHIGIQGKKIAKQNLPPSNLVFLVDVSGSMHSQNKLPLLIKGLKLLVNQMRAQDKVAIVVYAGASGLVLDSTSGNEKHKILAALEQLRAGGSTNGAAGIRLAYQTARAAYIEHGSNRIVLATDGDFNVGTVNFNALKDMVSRERESGIELTTLGFGGGNYNDKLMEQLADAGNGNYAYIDNLMEAQKALVEELGATLFTIAKDVKVQIEFNPNVVSQYRLIGYENRVLQREDFNNDKVDAGEIGAGHSVTALYEIFLKGSKGQLIDPLRYSDHSAASDGKTSELAFLKLRYKQPKGKVSRLLTHPVAVSSIKKALNDTSRNFRFAASVAAFAQYLRDGKYLAKTLSGNFGVEQIIALAEQSKGEDNNGYRGEYIRLVKLSQALLPAQAKNQR